ncbi:O-antigen ligase family protein [Hahella aquimaris]|uniref:O-antigen ligase family protein n=1 Tax=Hahella sp. HNIBRBA332 TaxID=3015983 RepID=UPI00273A87E9|nr:O-antigen ligase family protein [Hahella sp. HNIBRBA332]WLQ12214.1 O-antigen ligase family protein [Hahella sp. HNIBRBA332]
MLLAVIVGTPLLEGVRNTGLVGFMAIWLVNRFRAKDFKLAWDRWDLAVILFAFSMFATQLVVALQDDLATKVSHVLRYLILFFMLRYSQFSTRQYWLILTALTLSIFAGMAWSWPDYLSTHSFIVLRLPNIQHVNHASLYVLIVFQFLLSSFLYILFRRRWLLFAVLAVSLAVVGAWLMAASSRAAIGVAALSVGVALIPVVMRSRKIAVIVLAVLMSCSAVLITLFPGVVAKQNQWSAVFEGKLTPRERIWNTALEAYPEAPLLGRGYNEYKQLTEDYIKEVAKSRGETYNPDRFWFVEHAHNVYLTWLVEHGGVGLFCLLFFFLVWLITLFQDFPRLREDPIFACWWAIAMNTLLTLTVAGLVTTTMRRDTAFIALMALGLYLSYSRWGARRNDS